jgi:hypothetical protein
MLRILFKELGGVREGEERRELVSVIRMAVAG